MKNAVLFSSAIAVAMSGANVGLAQDAGDGTDTGSTERTSNGAIVTREEIVEQAVDENGEPIPVLDDEGNPVVDEEGNPVFETVAVGFVQTVSTPSGNIHTVTKEDGSRAIVTHEFANRPERVARAERIERPDRPDRPQRPDRPERPEKPEKPERPERPNRPGGN